MTDPLDVALHAVRALESAGVPCAIGGALALGIWAVPRATLDADINVFVEGPALKRAADALRDAGFGIETRDAMARWASGHVAHARFEGVHVDVFAPSVAFYAEAHRSVRRVPVGDDTAPFLSAEALAVFKLMFHRRKDIADLAALLDAAGRTLDRAWVRQQIVEMMGDDDERVVTWDALCAETG